MGPCIPEGKEAVVEEPFAGAPLPAQPASPVPSAPPAPPFAQGAEVQPAVPPAPAPAPAPCAQPAPALWCQNLTKTFAGQAALDRFSISVPAGRIVGLLGPNGSGKTTLLKMVAGVSHPTAGDIRVCGLPVGPQSKAVVSFLPERPYFSRSMRVREMIAYFADFYPDFDAAMAHDMLARLGVDPAAVCSSLSKGTVEKVQLTLVMARHAALYLLDEPIGGVDPAARDYILSTIIRGYRPASTVILSTHLVRDVESVLDDFILLRYGTMLLHAPVAYVTQEKGTTLDAYFREEFRC